MRLRRSHDVTTDSSADAVERSAAWDGLLTVPAPGAVIRADVAGELAARRDLLPVG